MGRDEAGTLARLKDYRARCLEPALVRNGGRLVKLTGDGVLAEFASAVDAVRAAIEFQQAVAQANADRRDADPLVFRAGLHLGDMIVDGDDLYGDGINVAARLEAEAPPGGVVVSVTVRDFVGERVPARFAELGDLALKNIERPIRAYRLEWDAEAWPAATRTASASPSAPSSQPAVPAPGLALPDKPSIAVLPFQNMSGDAEQEYFADGMVEDIITALSRFRSLFVIARNSSFTYKGKAVDVKAVGRELGVRYLLEGSVRKAGGRVRITGQLIDTGTGAHLWADRFDGALEDVFSLQDEVTEKVIAAIAPGVERAEIERAGRKPTASLSAHDCYLRASAFWWRAHRETSGKAIGLLQRALEIDPGHSSAMALLLAVHANRKMSGLVDNGEEDDADVERLIRHCVRVSQDDAVALGHAAYAIAAFLRDLDFAEEQIRRALALNANLASAWAFRGWVHVWSGNPGQALLDLSRAQRLDPMNVSGNWMSGWAHAYFFLDRHEEALQVAEGMLQLNPDALPALRVGAAAAAFGGRTDVAHKLAARLMHVDPAFRVSRLEGFLGPYRSAEFLGKYKEGVRRAGLPE